MTQHLAAQPHYAAHLAPVLALLPDLDVTLVASYADLRRARKAKAERIVLLQHGIGQSYSDDDPHYPGGNDNGDVGLFLVPNEHAAGRWRNAYPSARVEVVGSPRLDDLPRREPGPPTVAVTFHWDDLRRPEGRSAFQWFKAAVLELADAHHVIGHGHPKRNDLARWYAKHGIEYVPFFADVCRRADVLIADNTSVLYEFAATGRNVAVMDAPLYRPAVHHGLRFWEAADVGPRVSDPELLCGAVDLALTRDGIVALNRESALDIVFAYRTGAAQRAADAITDWAGTMERKPRAAVVPTKADSPRAVILVPRRDDDGPRDALWDGFCKPWWEREQSHMPIFEGYHTDGLFNRSAAVNRAARLAGDWDVAVIIDADVVCDATRVKEAVELAHQTGSMVLPHSERKDLSQQGTRAVVNGDTGSWEGYVRHRYSVDNGHPSVSSVVVISRRQWDAIGGFDETFRGWGYEDTAFAACAETFGGIIRMDGEVWHLWHPTAKEGKRGTASWSRNSAKGQRYRAAIGQPDAIRALQAEGRVTLTKATGIPRILHRVVPEHTTPEVDGWWARFEELHPDWDLRTHRDPLDPADWPLTSPHWPKAANGAQFADMIRLEAVLRDGGIYVDSDVEPLRRLDPLLALSAFAAWEDERCVPNAVFGAVPGHPAIAACLDLMLSRLPGDTWPAGPGVTTEILPGRDDVLVLPPGAFFPYHYKEKHRASEDFAKTQPWAFVVHRWAGSWLKTA